MYDKCFTTRTFGSLMFYFNFGNDRILLGGPDPYIDINYLTTVALPNNAHKVRFLHISRGNLEFVASARGWAPLRERFTGLEELVISFPAEGALHPYGFYDAQYSPMVQESEIKFDLYDCVNGEGDIVTKQWNPVFQLKLIHYANPEKKYVVIGCSQKRALLLVEVPWRPRSSWHAVHSFRAAACGDRMPTEGGGSTRSPESVCSRDATNGLRGGLISLIARLHRYHRSCHA